MVVAEKDADAVLAVSSAGQIIHANEAATRFLAGKDGSVVGRRLWPLVPQPERERFRRTVEQAFEHGEQVELSVPSRWEDRWYRLEVFPMEKTVSVHLRDITAERRLRDELSLRERALRKACEALADRKAGPREHIRGLLTHVRSTLGIEFATVSYIDAEEGSYRFEAVGADDEEVLPAGETVPLSEMPICASVATEGETVVLPDVAEQAPDLVDPAWGISAYVGAPIRVGDEVYGTFCFYSTEQRSEAFSDWEVTYVELFSDVASTQLERLLMEGSREPPLLSEDPMR